MFNEMYKDRRVLVTGHTGFKGSWMVCWLDLLGADVNGISLAPETSPNHWELLGLDIEEQCIDIRDEKRIRKAIVDINPDIVFHMAAQPLVRRSYRDPLGNWATNVMGTANVLDACRDSKNLKAVVVVTTDKCYDNKEWIWGYREIDPLGGYDPYSASKAGCELVASSYRNSFFNEDDSALIATVRAGNVIGGGDWSEDRLIPDLVRSVSRGEVLQIRSPMATRPWQHVLECLSGYLMLGMKLLEGDSSFADAWNFGPELDGNRTVEQVLMSLQKYWSSVEWFFPATSQLHEAQLLYLDSGKARNKLLWRPVMTFEECVFATADWYRVWLDNKDLLTRSQLKEYISLANERGLAWSEGSI